MGTRRETRRGFDRGAPTATPTWPPEIRGPETGGVCDPGRDVARGTVGLMRGRASPQHPGITVLLNKLQLANLGAAQRASSPRARRPRLRRASPSPLGVQRVWQNGGEAPYPMSDKRPRGVVRGGDDGRRRRHLARGLVQAARHVTCHLQVEIAAASELGAQDGSRGRPPCLDLRNQHRVEPPNTTQNQAPGSPK